MTTFLRVGNISPVVQFPWPPKAIDLWVAQVELEPRSITWTLGNAVTPVVLYLAARWWQWSCSQLATVTWGKVASRTCAAASDGVSCDSFLPPGHSRSPNKLLCDLPGPWPLCRLSGTFADKWSKGPDLKIWQSNHNYVQFYTCMEA